MSDLDNGEWFKAWFNSPYYHVLYDQRNDAEAEEFIDRMVKVVQLPVGSKALDLACGDGRHCRVLAKHGFEVTGIDLANESINIAENKAGGHERYMVDDIRTFQLAEQFDLITNLFTSFGYFNRNEENAKVLDRVHQHLNKEGYFILDFLNLTYVKLNLVEEEIVQKQGVQFVISRSIESGQIVKKIKIIDQGQIFHFTEYVQALDIDVLTSLFLNAGFKILTTFGDYFLGEYNRTQSPRVILLAKKA